jgi:hypothetical protein
MNRIEHLTVLQYDRRTRCLVGGLLRFIIPVNEPSLMMIQSFHCFVLLLLRSYKYKDEAFRFVSFHFISFVDLAVLLEYCNSIFEHDCKTYPPLSCFGSAGPMLGNLGVYGSTSPST